MNNELSLRMQTRVRKPKRTGLPCAMRLNENRWTHYKFTYVRERGDYVVIRDYMMQYVRPLADVRVKVA